MNEVGNRCFSCGGNAVFICKSDKILFCGTQEHINEHLDQDSGMYIHEISKLSDKSSTELNDSEFDKIVLIESGVPVHSYVYPISCLALRDSSLFVAEKDGVSNFDLTTGIQLWKVDKKKLVWSVCVSNNGNMLAIALDDGSLEVLNSINGKNINSLKPFTNYSVTVVLFSSDCHYLISGSSNGDLCIYNSPSFSAFASANLFPSAVLCCSISHNNRIIFCGTSTGDIGYFNIQSKTKTIAQRVHNSAVTSLVCTRSGFLISAGLDGKICKWSAETSNFIQEISSFPHKILSMTLGPDSSEIYFTDSKFNINNLKIESRKLEKIGKINRDMVSGLVFDAKKNLIYGIFGHRTVIAIQPSSLQIQGTIGNSDLLMARTTLDKKYLVCGFTNGWVKFFSLSTSKVEHEFHYEDGMKIFSQYQELGISIEII